MKTLAYLLVSAAAVAAAPAAHAATSVYSSLAAFNAATTGVSTVNFEGTTGSTYVGPGPYSAGGLSIQSTAPAGWLFLTDPSYTTYYYDWGTGDVLVAQSQGSVTVTFASAVTAFGIELGTFRDDNNPSTPPGAPSTLYGDTVTIGTAQGDFAVGTGQRPNLTFFGVTSDTAFTSFTLTNAAGFTVFDNVRFGAAAAPVPEPATWAMMIGGFGLVGGAMRRRREQGALQAA